MVLIRSESEAIQKMQLDLPAVGMDRYSAYGLIAQLANG